MPEIIKKCPLNPKSAQNNVFLPLQMCIKLMNLKYIFDIIRNLSAKQMWALLVLSVKHPAFAAMTLYATLKTFGMAQQYYPKTHQLSGRGNAFRHSLWCCMILNYCCKISSPRKATLWCYQFSNLYEELFFSSCEAKIMDLHNNKVGILMFEEMLPGIHRQFFESNFFVPLLQKKVQEAVVFDCKNYPFIPQTTMIFLTED
jgi:hypothetical protein